MSCLKTIGIKLVRFLVPTIRDVSSQIYFQKRSISHTKDIKPYKIIFDNETIEDLRHRIINNKVFTPSFQKHLKTNKCNSNLIKGVLYHWANRYDYKKREKYINRYKHYMINVNGLNVHYMHIKHNPENILIKPTLCLHGWPNSVMEFYPYILDVKKSGAPFELIIPSLPGFGFCGIPNSSQFSSMGLNNILLKLTSKLLKTSIGFDIVCGNSFLNRASLSFTPNKGKNYSVLQIYDRNPIFDYNEIWKMTNIDFHDAAIQLKGLQFTNRHRCIDAMREKSLEFGLRDSPVALAAYILEKHFINQEKYNTLNTRNYNYNSWIDNIMFYWTSRNIVTSMRMCIKCLDNKYNESNILKQSKDS